MGESRVWSIELDVREDASRMFVPAHLLPDAVDGDAVTITSTSPAEVRHGRIVETLDDEERGRFFVVSLE